MELSFRIRRRISRLPGPIFHGRYLHRWKRVSAIKVGAVETSRRELSEDVLFGVGTLLVVEQSTLEPPSGRCDIHNRIRYRV